MTDRLSPREGECISLLCRGMSIREISKALGLAVPTVAMHLKRARERISARTREHAVAIAILEIRIDVAALAVEIKARPPLQ